MGPQCHVPELELKPSGPSQDPSANLSTDPPPQWHYNRPGVAKVVHSLSDPFPQNLQRIITPKPSELVG